jgi:hypothetical protein
MVDAVKIPEHLAVLSNATSPPGCTATFHAKAPSEGVACRAAFEKWRTQNGKVSGYLGTEMYSDDYANSWTQTAWLAWQAAWSRPTPAPDALVEAIIRYIDDSLADADGREINPSNYAHDDACHVNDGYVQLFGTLENVRTMLQKLPTPAPDALAEALEKLERLRFYKEAVGDSEKYACSNFTLNLAIGIVKQHFGGKP